MNNLTKNLKSVFKNRGFNLFKIIESREYDKLFTDSQKSTGILQNCESIIIVGFMGSDFWGILTEYLNNNPGFANHAKDIIDEYSVTVINQSLELIKSFTSNYKTVYPFGDTAYNMDFTTLGKLSGTGVESILGLLINPEFGTWISFRGAILSDLEFNKYDKPIDYFNPCPKCSKPCIVACPANTVTESGWDWKKCLDFRINDAACKNNCYSRRACPYGVRHQYSNEQFAHHHMSVIKDYKN